ncbi:MAG: AraC family transcriptional regulator [Erysipelotrichaceae bacterium]|nr:AraC family transcriptional regulator [Erysipelotrichaceae bacterium]MDY5251580.1 AraC family transcriptional regulator [Erysipelotrichaceae bacterium]
MYKPKYSILNINYNKNSKLKHFYSCIKPFFKLLFVTKGNCVVIINNNEFCVSEGDGIIIPPYVIHNGIFESLNTVELIEIQFNLLNEAEQYLLVNEISKKYCFSIPSFFDLKPLILSALKNRDNLNNIETICDVSYLIDKTMIQLINSLPAKLPTLKLKHENYYKIIEQIFMLLDSDLEHNNNIQAICNNLHISNTYLYKCTSTILGTSPQNLLINYKINKAFHLLKNKELTITNIANLLYYNNSFYFSKQFKDNVGLSPNQYRNKFYKDLLSK